MLAEQAGADCLCVQGAEAGAHRGSFTNDPGTAADYPLAALLARWRSRIWLGSLRDAIHNRHTMRTPSPADKKAGAKL